MPVQWGKVEVPLTGLDQKTAAAHVLPGGLVNVENARFDSLGNLTKRTGWDVLSPFVATQTPYRLVAHRDEMLALDNRACYTYDSQGGDWYPHGDSPKFHAERIAAARPSDVASTSAGLYQVKDVAQANGYRVIAYTYDLAGFTQARIATFDVGTGGLVETFTLDENPRQGAVRLVAVGNYIFIVYARVSSVDVAFSRYDTTTNPISRTSEATIPTTNTLDYDVWDASPVQLASDRWVIAGKTSGAATVEVEIFDTASTPVSQRNATLTPAAGTPAAPFVVQGYLGEDVWLAWDDGTHTRIWSATEAGLASNFTDKAIFSSKRCDRIGFGRIDSGTVCLAGDYDNSGVTTLLYNTCTDGGTLGTERNVPGLSLVAQPWGHDSQVHALTHYASSTTASDPTFYIYRLTDTSDATEANPVLLGTIARTTAAAAAGGVIPHTTDPGGANRFLTGISVSTAFAALDDDEYITDKKGADFLLVDARASYLFDRRFLSAPWGPCRVFAGAQMMVWDGEAMRDNGHTMRPDFDTLNVNKAGSVTYKYVIVWEWTNAQGQIERSAPSAEVTAASAKASVSITVDIPAYIPGNREDAVVGVRAALYRTKADGSLYFLVGHYDPDRTGASAPVDHLADADLELNEPLYTDGGVLPNIGPPACTHVAEHRERLFAVGLDGDPEGIAFTKVYKLGTAPEWVADAFVIRIPGAHKLTAVASLDTALVVFSKTNTWLVFGDGPPDTGANLGAGVGGISGFQVQHVTGDVGCDNPRSIVVTPQGIMFQSGKGIYMLDRSYSMQKAGAVVDRILDSYSRVTGATLVPDKTEVHFALSDGGSAEDGARILVYDYFAEFWAVDNLSVGTGITSIAAYDGAAVTDPEMWFSDLNGSIYKSDLSNYDDAGSFYAMRLETGPIALDTIAGYQRVRRVTIGGYGAGAHGLSVDFEYDNDKNTVGTWDDTVSRSEAQMTASGYPVRINLPRQKTRTLRMRLTETTPAGSAGEVVWSTVVFEAGFKQGTTKLPAINTG